LKAAGANKKIVDDSAVFWDGNKQLSGTLELSETALVFLFDDFNQSNLKLKIQVAKIQYVNVFKVYNVSNVGLKIISQDKRIDLFVLEKAKVFYQKLKEKIQHLPAK